MTKLMMADWSRPSVHHQQVRKEHLVFSNLLEAMQARVLCIMSCILTCVVTQFYEGYYLSLQPSLQAELQRLAGCGLIGHDMTPV